MTALWTAAEAAAATGGRSIGDWQVSGISIDTRDLVLGDMFVALKDARDGHDFVAAALAKGASAAMVSYWPDGISPDAPLLLVSDVLRGLEDLGRAARARTDARVIAVTGSVGKTTTKEMLRTALEGQGQVHAAVMSLNNHWGVPLTLARMPADTDFAILEIGMNHANEITPLSQMARPHVAVITTVAAAHMAAFSSVEDIAHAKAEVFDGLEPGGTAILNLDIDTFDVLAIAAANRTAEILTFGANKAADYMLTDTHNANGATIVLAEAHGISCLYKLGTPGRHVAMNSLAVLAAVEAVGADPVISALDLAKWQPPAGRGQRHWIVLDPVKSELRLELIDDAYNANPASMTAAFEVLAASQPIDGLGRIKTGRRIAFLSDMLELGDKEDALHAALAELPSMDAIDVVHSAGPLMKNLHDNLASDKQGQWHQTAEDLAKTAHGLLDAGDVVMVKGSKGSRAALVVDAIKKMGQATVGK
ncbi:MAG: UDP-N-acetylmuramoyl-tripeptide--D-alanyl-D-alanine ligase [Paracoccaceae bacterium]|jgi:UDP-N-acetylmuramoyl-tripeptide--D-alanyl-D-alanine ligase